MGDTREQKERLTLQREMAKRAQQINEETRRKDQAERLRVTPRNSPSDEEMERRRDWLGAFEDSVRQYSPRRDPV